MAVIHHLKNPDDIIDPEKLKSGIRTSCIGRNIIYYDRAESTNTTAVELARLGEPEGTVVVAEEQTQGKGRLGRQWIGTAHKNILMSVIFRPEVDPSGLFSITMLTSVALVKAIKDITKIRAGIKWPNDIYIGGKKTAGILTETDAGKGRVNYVVVGIGLNVNFNPSGYPEISGIATSLMLEGGREFPRAPLLESILEEIDKWYIIFKKGQSAGIYDEWERHSIILGRRVKIISPGETLEGIAESVDPDGALILAGDDGGRRKILSGDVSLRFAGD